MKQEIDEEQEDNAVQEGIEQEQEWRCRIRRISNSSISIIAKRYWIGLAVPVKESPVQYRVYSMNNTSTANFWI